MTARTPEEMVAAALVAEQGHLAGLLVGMFTGFLVRADLASAAEIADYLERRQQDAPPILASTLGGIVAEMRTPQTRSAPALQLIAGGLHEGEPNGRDG